MSNVLIVAPHPDDETLGCGGTMLKHKDNGDNLFWLLLTNCTDYDKWGKETIEMTQNQIEKVSELYSITKTIKLDYEVNKLEVMEFVEVTEKISKIISEIKPEIVYVHNRSDIHSEHRIAFSAIMSASKSFNHKYIKKIIMYETISETDYAPALPENIFIPNYFVDISNYIEKKNEIMKIYSTELKEHPFPRSERNIRALATQRGSQCGVDSAEAFMILKEIWK